MECATFEKVDFASGKSRHNSISPDLSPKTQPTPKHDVVDDLSPKTMPQHLLDEVDELMALTEENQSKKTAPNLKERINSLQQQRTSINNDKEKAQEELTDFFEGYLADLPPGKLPVPKEFSNKELYDCLTQEEKVRAAHIKIMLHKPDKHLDDEQLRGKQELDKLVEEAKRRLTVVKKPKRPTPPIERERRPYELNQPQHAKLQIDRERKPHQSNQPQREKSPKNNEPRSHQSYWSSESDSSYSSDSSSSPPYSRRNTEDDMAFGFAYSDYDDSIKFDEAMASVYRSVKNFFSFDE